MTIPNDCTEFVIRETTCKNCGKQLRIRIAADNIAFGESILPLAHCNRCADAKEDRRKAEKHIYDAAFLLQHATRASEDPKFNPVRSTLHLALENWTYAEAKVRCVNACRLDNRVYEAILEHPDKVSDILRHWSDGIVETSKREEP